MFVTLSDEGVLTTCFLTGSMKPPYDQDIIMTIGIHGFVQEIIHHKIDSEESIQFNVQRPRTFDADITALKIKRLSQLSSLDLEYILLLLLKHFLFSKMFVMIYLSHRRKENSLSHTESRIERRRDHER